MSIKGLFWAVFFCVSFLICLFSWILFRESHVSEKVLREYRELPEKCGSSKLRYTCNALIENMSATDSEKFWLKRHDSDFIVPFMIFFGLIEIVNAITKEKKHSQTDFNKNWKIPDMSRGAYIKKETELQILRQKELGKDTPQKDEKQIMDFKNEEAVTFDWSEVPFEYKKRDVL